MASELTRPLAARSPRAPLSSLIGRERDVAALVDLVRAGRRLVTLVGPGGVGKTRLATQVAADMAHEFDGGAVFVDLAPIRDPDLVLPTVARSLGAFDTGSEASLADIQRSLGPASLLMVLDNLEQVTEAAPAIGALLDGCPNLRILATSREPLRIAGEQEFPLAPLALPGVDDDAFAADRDAVPPAIALFVDRARGYRPDFTMTARNADTIAEICRRLDGLPLGIELAAAWCRVLTPEALLLRLSSRLDLLRGGHRTLPERQKTMRAAIGWSYELLDAGQRATFRSLAVFRGSWSLDAAEAVAPDQVDILDAIAALVERSLVQRADDETGETRFRMLETVREYAGEQLAASGEEEAIRAAHAAFAIGWAERLARTSGAATWDHFERDHANIRNALDWLHSHGDAGDALRLVAAMSQFWYAHSYLREGSAWLEAILARVGDTASFARAKALLGLGVLTHYLGDDSKAERVLQQALAFGRDLGDRRTTGAALLYLGVLAEDRGAYEPADRMYQEAIPLLRDTAPDLAAQTVAHRGVVATGLGDLDAAERFCLDGLELARAAADPIGEFVARNWLADLARERGDLVTSATRFASLLGDIGFSWPGGLRERGRAEDASILLPGIAALLVAVGRPEEAAVLFGAGTAVREEVGLTLFLPEREQYERAEAAVDAALGAAAAAELRAAGSRLTPSEYAARADAALAAITGSQTTARPRSSSRGGPAEPVFNLTRREAEVLRLLAEGLTNAQLAERLSISPSTVSSHLERIFAKLDVTTRGAAVAIAHRLGVTGTS